MRELGISDFQLLGDSETVNVKGFPILAMKRETFRNEKEEIRLNIYTLIRTRDNAELATWSDNASVFEPGVVTIDTKSEFLDFVALELLHVGYSVKEGNL